MKSKVAVLGLGGRGMLYSDIVKTRCGDTAELVAVCDILQAKRKRAAENFGLPDEMIFDDYKMMLSRGKLADILIIATQDADHYEHAMAALDVGYDILLEKPIAPSEDECIRIAEKAVLAGRRVAVAHVLRYTPFYQTVKDLIDDGAVGKVMTVSQTENVNYLHQAHSYVRGNWRNSRESSPMILAKSCHDLDIIKWLIGESCLAVTSFGSLSYYREENAPAGSSERCIDCGLRDECVYDAVKFYSNDIYGFELISKGNPDFEDVMRTSGYGKCVYKCDNDVVDHQVVNMLFGGGATAQFTMTAFSATGHRYIKVHGTTGEIEGDVEEGKINLRVFGRPHLDREIVMDKGINLSDGSIPGEHAGNCDARLLQDFLAYVAGDSTAKGLTGIDVSLESHMMCFLAERSRLNGGEVYRLNKSKN